MKKEKGRRGEEKIYFVSFLFVRDERHKERC